LPENVSEMKYGKTDNFFCPGRKLDVNLFSNFGEDGKARFPQVNIKFIGVFIDRRKNSESQRRKVKKEEKD